MGHVVGRAVRAGLDLLLPPHCLTCDRVVQRQGALCSACFTRTQFITAPFCRRCAAPFTRPNAAGECDECAADPPPWTEARAALRYDEQSKRLILPLKYGDRTELARSLAPMLMRAGADLLHAADWVVPVPLHRRRLAARRYNQAALLAAASARLAGRPARLDALRRVRATVPLAELTREQRAAELEGAIVVPQRHRPALADSRVVLVDDVLTSGATARACVAALTAAGVARVDVLAVARVRAA